MIDFRKHWPLYSLMIGVLLAPWIGGQVPVGILPIEGWFSSFWAAPEAPQSAYWLISLFILVPLAVAIFGPKRVLSMPRLHVLVPLSLFFLTLVASVTTSDFRWVTLLAILQWICYGLALLSVIATTGRGNGPTYVMAALVAGATIVAISGIREYAGMRAIDPSWRIFAGWINQNALAGMLTLGLFPALALGHLDDRRVRLFSGLSATLIGFAIVLTQSKGGLLAVAIGTLTYLVLNFVWGGLKETGRVLLPLVGVAALAGLLVMTQPKGRPGALDRVANAQATQEQSGGFRQNLWRGSIKSIQENPAGYGLNTYQFNGSRAGLTPPTKYAHSTPLQLGMEATPFAPILFTLFFGIWTFEMFRGARALPQKANLLRAGIFSAVLASLAHNQLDSLLYHFGIGIGLFILMGLGLQLAADGNTPEVLPRAFRAVVAGTAVVACLVGMPYAAVWENRLGAAAAATQSGTTEGFQQAKKLYESASNLAALDGTSRWQLAAFETDPTKRLALGEVAVQLHPSLPYLRGLASAYQEAGEFGKALSLLNRALTLDPNNPKTRLARAELAEAVGNSEEVKKELEDLVKTEETPYFRVRAIPEIVPTETYVARWKLSGMTEDAAERRALLQEAESGLRQYATTTLPRVLALTKGLPSATFGGESVRSAREVVQVGTECSAALAEIYDVSGEPEKAAELRRFWAEAAQQLLD